MSMKAGAALILTQLAAITTPAAPSKTVQVPPGFGDRVPKGAKVESWINLEPTGQDRSDEANRSGLRQYQFTAHYWVRAVDNALTTTADTIMDMTDALMDKLAHNTLGGWARQGIEVADFKATMEGGGDDDTLYVVRLPFTVWKQETT